MAIFPKIQSPCPYKGPLSDIMSGDICRLCKREVVDITAMSDAARVALIAGCSDKICVSYRLPLRPALAAVAIAAAVVAVPTAAAACDDTAQVEWVTVGGINDPANAQYVQVKDDGTVADLPVVYEGTAGGTASTAVANSKTAS